MASARGFAFSVWAWGQVRSAAREVWHTSAGSEPRVGEGGIRRRLFVLRLVQGRHRGETVTHHVEGSNNPDWIGGKLVRSYRFVGKDRIALTVLTNFDGTKVANGAVLVWERVRRLP